jgi:signal recognition particle subunit SEC65
MVAGAVAEAVAGAGILPGRRPSARLIVPGTVAGAVAEAVAGAGILPGRRPSGFRRHWKKNKKYVIVKQKKKIFSKILIFCLKNSNKMYILFF